MRKVLDFPKEFTGCEEDFQQWLMKTEGFCAGVISGVMLDWSAEQATEVTTTAIDLELLPTVTNVERRFETWRVLQQMHTALMALTW